jgi:hypothetical protein
MSVGAEEPPTVPYGGAVALLDELFPDFEVRERHQIALPVSSRQALELALASPAVPDGTVRLLFRLRGLAIPRGSLEEFATTRPFRELGRTETEFVAGLSREALRIAFAFRAEPHQGGSLLSTETRVRAFSTRARWAFRLYWLLVGPFSGLIRRRWLAVIAARTR